MLTDAILSEAAAEVERFLLSIVPEDGEPHVFSKQFERKMQKLIRRTDHPVRYQVMRVAAAVVLAIATLFGAVIAISPEARAAVVGWVKGTFAEFYEYSITPRNMNDVNNLVGVHDSSTSGETQEYQYYLSAIPEGYRELRIIDLPDGRTCLYVNDSGNILQFSYTYGTVEHHTLIEVAKYNHSVTIMDKNLADVYIAVEEDKANVIIWQDAHSNVLFRIHAYLDAEELIKLAEDFIK